MTAHQRSNGGLFFGEGLKLLCFSRSAHLQRFMEVLTLRLDEEPQKPGRPGVQAFREPL